MLIYYTKIVLFDLYDIQKIFNDKKYNDIILKWFILNKVIWIMGQVW